MIIALICAAVAAAVVLVGCVPVPSRFFLETFDTEEVRATLLDEHGNTVGGSISVGVAEVRVRILHERSRWVRWLEEF